MRIKLFFYSLAVISIILFGCAFPQYIGNPIYYVAFSVLANALFIYGFLSRSFFALFIGTFFWLGFWVKFSYRIWRLNHAFVDPVGLFDYSAQSYDHALMVSSVGLSGFLLSFFVTNLIKSNSINNDSTLDSSVANIPNAYIRNYKKIWFIFLLLIIVVPLVNFYFGIYQRGEISQTSLPFGLNGVFKWLLLFGLASISALLINYEITLKSKRINFVIFLAIIEGLFSSVSMLSRGMVLNLVAIFLGAARTIKIPNSRKVVIWGSIHLLAFISFFYLSVNLSDQIRLDKIISTSDQTQTQTQTQTSKIQELLDNPFFVDRWVGIEGVMAVSSMKNLGWDVWNDAWSESYDEQKISYYDSLMPDSPYKNNDFKKHHFISLPGVIAFFYYPGSEIFLFLSVFVIGLVFIKFENQVFYFTKGNLIICALLSEVVASRLSNFGYVPKQSYLILIAILINLALIASFNYSEKYFNRLINR